MLNFGVSGSGFQEQFFLWEKYSQHYGLDYILIGPRWFHPDRSATFRKNWFFQNRKSLHYPHDRLILSSDNTLKQVHIKGKTLKKRYKNYYSLIPSWTALRYDIRPFFISEHFLNLEKYKNPFYYYKDPQTNKILSLDYGSVIKKEDFSMAELNVYDPIIGKEIAKINTLSLGKNKKTSSKKNSCANR